MNDSDMNVIIGILMSIWFFALIFIILQLIGTWKMYKKAGIPGWHSIIPILNVYDWYKMAGFGMAGRLLATIGMSVVMVITIGAAASGNENAIAGSAMAMVLVGIIVAILQIMSYFKVASRFGKGIGAGILFLLFTPIMCMIAGLSSSWKYCREH